MDPRKKRIRRLQRLAEAAVPLKHFWEVPGPGCGKKLPRKQKVQSGNRSAYLVNRIARDRPDVLERMKAGEFETVRDAARGAVRHGHSRHGSGRITQWLRPQIVLPLHISTCHIASDMSY